MSDFSDAVRSKSGRLIWLDYAEYAGRLLAGGEAPWLDSAACAAFVRKAQGLLRPDVLPLPLERVTAAWLSVHTSLREAMGAKTRAVFPIKVLLSDESLRAHLLSLCAALRGSVAGVPFALSLPSPRAWVIECYRQAHGIETEADDDAADSASLYVADFLRVFGESAIDAVEFVETPSTEPASVSGLACYRSVLNVAAHYRWAAGLRIPGARFDGQGDGIDFITSPGDVEGALHGYVLSSGFWRGQSPPAARPDGFRFAVVPVDTPPEQVLERLESIR